MCDIGLMDKPRIFNYFLHFNNAKMSLIKLGGQISPITGLTKCILILSLSLLLDLSKQETSVAVSLKSLPVKKALPVYSAKKYNFKSTFYFPIFYLFVEIKEIKKERSAVPNFGWN